MHGRAKAAQMALACALYATSGAHAAQVSGFVRDASSGNTVAGARVVLAHHPSPFESELVGEIVTGPDGAFAFSTPLFGWFGLGATLAPYIPVSDTFFVDLQNPIPVFRIIDMSLASSITVTVRSAMSLTPLPDSSISIYQPGSGVTTQVDASGQIVFSNLTAGNYHVCVDDSSDAYLNECTGGQWIPLDGGYAATTPIALGSGANLAYTIDLDPGSRIAGTLRDGFRDAPVDAPVSVLACLATLGSACAQTTQTVDPQSGAYAVEGLAPGSYRVYAGNISTPVYNRELYPDIPCPAGGCDPALGQVLSLGELETIDGIDFELFPGAVATGRVTDSVTGAGLAGVAVAAYDVFFGPIEISRTLTDSQGNYALSHILQGNMRIGTAGQYTHRNEGWPDVPCYSICANGTPAPFVAGLVHPGFDLALDPAAWVSGSVLSGSEGEPVPASVVVRNHDASIVWGGEVGADGSFRSFGLPSGVYYAFARVNESPAFPCQVWQGRACLPEFPFIDIAQATPIVIAVPGPVVGIDFTMPSRVLFAHGFEN